MAPAPLPLKSNNQTFRALAAMMPASVTRERARDRQAQPQIILRWYPASIFSGRKRSFVTTPASIWRQGQRSISFLLPAV